MPKKFRKVSEKFPKLRNPLKKLKKKNNKEKNENKDAINLLAAFNIEPQNVFQVPRPTKLYRQLILTILGIFSIGLFINNIVQNRLDVLKEELDLAEERVLEVIDVEEETISLSNRIQSYKTLLEKHTIFTDKLDTVLGPLNISNLSGLLISKEGFSFSYPESSPYSASILIGKYMEDENIDYIVLQSASFDVRENLVKLSIKGGFK